MELWTLVMRRLEQAANAVGTLTALVATGVYGLASAVAGQGVAIYVTITVFGFCGALEVFYRQRRATLQQRTEPRQNSVLFDKLLKHKHHWQPKLYEKLQYRHFQFNAIGFEEIPFPLTVTSPLGPRCERHVTFRNYVNCWGAVRCRGKCGFCGYEKTIEGTVEELVYAAYKAIIAIRDDSCHHAACPLAYDPRVEIEVRSVRGPGMHHSVAP